jgi:hypothetical protein
VEFDLQLAVSLAEADRSAELHRAARALAERCREPFWRHVLLSNTVGYAIDAGDLERAERAAEEASRPVETSLDSWQEPEGLYGLRMFHIRREQGRLAEVAPALRLITRTAAPEGLWRAGYALLLVELDRLDDAAEQFDLLARDDFATLPMDDNRFLHVCYAAETCVALGRADAAPALEAELARTAGRIINLIGACLHLGPADRYLGLLRAIQGDVEGATARLDAALDLARRARSPLWVARVLADMAVVLGDATAAREAEALAQQHGLLGVARRLGASGTAPPR